MKVSVYKLFLHVPSMWWVMNILALSHLTGPFSKGSVQVATQRGIFQKLGLQCLTWMTCT